MESDLDPPSPPSPHHEEEEEKEEENPTEPPSQDPIDQDESADPPNPIIEDPPRDSGDDTTPISEEINNAYPSPSQSPPRPNHVRDMSEMSGPDISSPRDDERRPANGGLGTTTISVIIRRNREEEEEEDADTAAPIATDHELSASSSSSLSETVNRVLTSPWIDNLDSPIEHGHKRRVHTRPGSAIAPRDEAERSRCEGYAFTCFLDYNRYIRLPPPLCYHPNFVRLENLPYDNVNEYVSWISSPPGSTLAARQMSIVRTSTPSFSLICRPKEVHPHPAIGVAVDVIELPKQYLFVVEVRGLKNTNLKVRVENSSILKISGRRKQDDSELSHDFLRCICVEREGRNFTRKFNLPPNIIIDNISAAFHRGLIYIALPKKPSRSQHKPLKDLNVMIMA